MAIYHLEAKIVSRGAGRSAVAAAAYLSCSRMLNEYDGVQHDYTRKQGLPKRKPLRRLRGQGWQFGRNAALSSGSRRSRNPPRRAHVPDQREGYHRLL